MRVSSPAFVSPPGVAGAFLFRLIRRRGAFYDLRL